MCLLPLPTNIAVDCMWFLSQEPDDVPGLHHETFYVVDDSPEARNADGASPVKGVMTHTSASGPRALAALFGASTDTGHWSTWYPPPPPPPLLLPRFPA